MTNKLVPDLIVESVFEITPELLIKMGIKGVLVDLDYTLAERHIKEPEDAVIDWVTQLEKNNIKASIISNNNQKRVDLFNKKLGLKYNISDANKPFRKSFLDAANKMELLPKEIAVIGDQIFTDVFGGNSVGMFTIMVNPKKRRQSFFYIIRRQLEKPFIRKYEKLRIKNK